MINPGDITPNLKTKILEYLKLAGEVQTETCPKEKRKFWEGIFEKVPKALDQVLKEVERGDIDTWPSFYVGLAYRSETDSRTDMIVARIMNGSEIDMAKMLEELMKAAREIFNGYSNPAETVKEVLEVMEGAISGALKVNGIEPPPRELLLDTEYITAILNSYILTIKKTI